MENELNEAVQGSPTLPPELVDRIAFEVDTVNDLRALAAVSKAWRRTIFPDHIKYRECSLDRTDIAAWKELSDTPRKALLVRTLRISGPELDQNWTPAQTEAIEAAAWHFRHLRALEIKCGDISGLLPFFDNLRFVAPPIAEIKFSGVRMSDATNTDTECFIIDSLGGFQRFCWSCATPLRDQAHVMSTIGRMLNRCPDLVSLHLSQYDFPTVLPVAFSPFWEARMPQLRELRLERICGHELEAQFLHDHPCLEVVTHWPDDVSEPLRNLPAGSLPMLRDARIRCTRPDVYTSLVSSLPDGRFRPIQNIRISLESFGDINRVIVFCRHLRQVDTLRRLELGPRDMRANMAGVVTILGHACPHVTELSLLSPLHEHPEATQNWIFAISAFSSLEILRGFMGRISMVHHARSLLLKSCFEACPRLRTIDGNLRPPTPLAELGGLNQDLSSLD